MKVSLKDVLSFPINFPKPYYKGNMQTMFIFYWNMQQQEFLEYFVLNILPFIYLFICESLCDCARASTRGCQNTGVGVLLSFHYVVPRNHSQVIRVGGNNLTGAIWPAPRALSNSGTWRVYVRRKREGSGGSSRQKTRLDVLMKSRRSRLLQLYWYVSVYVYIIYIWYTHTHMYILSLSYDTHN